MSAAIDTNIAAFASQLKHLNTHEPTLHIAEGDKHRSNVALIKFNDPTIVIVPDGNGGGKRMIDPERNKEPSSVRFRVHSSVSEGDLNKMAAVIEKETGKKPTVDRAAPGGNLHSIDVTGVGNIDYKAMSAAITRLAEDGFMPRELKNVEIDPLKHTLKKDLSGVGVATAVAALGNKISPSQNAERVSTPPAQGTAKGNSGIQGR